MLIDFHTHFIPQSYPAVPPGADPAIWPRLEPKPDGADMYVGDKLFRGFEDFYWNVEKRLTLLDAAGTDVQVLSPLPELLSYWLDAASAIALAEAVNAAGARMVAQAPTRFRQLAILPLQDIVTSLRQLETLVQTPGLVGLFLGSNVNGVSIAAPQFDPVFAAAERLGLTVFIHGIRPAALERLQGPPLMAAVLGIPHETASAAGSFMMRDILGQFPRLKLVFSHGGGSFGAVLDRMTLVWEKFPAMRETLKIPPAEYAKRFFYDSVVFGPEYLTYLLGRVGPTQILAGSDGPTEIGQKNLAGFIAASGADAAAQDFILGGNASALLAA